MSPPPGTDDDAGHDRFEHDDAAFVLGSLSPREHAAFADHLVECAFCAASVTRLSDVPDLLARVPADVVAGLALADGPADGQRRARDEAPPPRLLTTLLSRARADRRRRYATMAGAALAGAAAAALLLALLLDHPRAASPLAGGPGSPRPTATASATATSTAVGPPLVLEPVGQNTIHATAGLVTVAWGTRLELRCAYAGPSRYSAPEGYALVVHDRWGLQQRVATWRAVAGRTIEVPAATSIRRQDITGLDVVAADGRVVLTADL